MNPAGGKLPSTPRLSEYATNALEKIRKELRMFANGDAQVCEIKIINMINQLSIKIHRSFLLYSIRPSGYFFDYL